MKEKNIILNHIDPLALWGINNQHFEKISKAFPDLKMVLRGDEIQVSGSVASIARFEKKLEKLVKASGHKKNDNHWVDDILENGEQSVTKNDQKGFILTDATGKPIRAFTVNQIKLVENSAVNDLVFAVGPAGSGKTYTAIALAVKALKSRQVKRIILSRPAVEAGENLGYLPGHIKDKLDPYLQPLYDALQDMIPSKMLKDYFEERIIEIAPLAYMRGRTLDNAFVILDEAQNATLGQLKMFLTRMGRSARFIVTGDLTQIDLPRKTDSGLTSTLKMLEDIEGISIVHFQECDIIRHKLVKFIVQAFETKTEK
ncbi:MAG: phosphate starvation-inducible protein PhoH [Bacteroidetes bacterium HGW-Bacteroidetes-21]|nr:MAG: phosphate starvation-inducible protein PhoH [Bacteroidetes bacterium HGW-Bacteroidetes-21]